MDISTYKPGIVYSIYIAATPEKVWQALTSAEFSRQYFSGLAVEVEESVGGAFCCVRRMARCTYPVKSSNAIARASSP